MAGSTVNFVIDSRVQYQAPLMDIVRNVGGKITCQRLGLVDRSLGEGWVGVGEKKFVWGVI